MACNKRLRCTSIFEIVIQLFFKAMILINLFVSVLIPKHFNNLLVYPLN